MHKSGRLERGVELPGDAHIGLGNPTYYKHRKAKMVLN